MNGMGLGSRAAPIDAPGVRTGARFGLLFVIGLAGCPEHPLDDARRLEREGQLREAGRRYLAAARQDPANLAAWDGAVELICRREADVGGCLEVLDLELSLLGNLQRHRDVLAEVLERRASARLEQGLVDAALEDLERADRASPDRPGVLVARAQALMAKGRGSEALQALTRARRLDPRNAKIQALLGALPTDTSSASPPQDERRFGGE